MSKQLRAVLTAHKESALLRAFQLGKTSIADDLAFPSEAGTPVCPDNIGPRYMEPELERAGLRKFRFHDLRHTGNTLAASSGASTRELMHRMGHASMRAALIYQHVTSGRDREIAAAIDARIGRRK